MGQPELTGRKENKGMLSIQEAARWATDYLNREVRPSSISYLIQYSLLKKVQKKSSKTMVDIQELKEYYDRNILLRVEAVSKDLGENLDWELAFDHIPEYERTKHVHRLHPYKGKFIPQLVEYFLDSHTDRLKKEVYFNKGDIVLDPFMGSGTTLVQASEMGVNSIGIDISEFNCLIVRSKTGNYDLFMLGMELRGSFAKLKKFSEEKFNDDYDTELKKKISEFNRIHFRDFDFKAKVKAKEVDYNAYSGEMLELFYRENTEFIRDGGARSQASLLKESDMPSFVKKWFTKRIRQELQYYANLIKEEKDEAIRGIMRVILSRTARSCRATTHSDLATLVEPQYGPYYCGKHYKICTPINSIIEKLKKNIEDTIERLDVYYRLHPTGKVKVLHADSRDVDLSQAISAINVEYGRDPGRLVDGVFTSPPYVGQIDYHEQHAYAYELFSIQRADENEIGRMKSGKGKKAQREYVDGISRVLSNTSRYVKNDGYFFIVANDKLNLYPEIAELSGMEIVRTFHRPVFDRTERDRRPYSESIFMMRKRS